MTITTDIDAFDFSQITSAQHLAEQTGVSRLAEHQRLSDMVRETAKGLNLKNSTLVENMEQALHEMWANWLEYDLALNDREFAQLEDELPEILRDHQRMIQAESMTPGLDDESTIDWVRYGF